MYNYFYLNVIHFNLLKKGTLSESHVKQTSAWNEFKSLSIDIYQNIPITSINNDTSINKKISNLKNNFERNDTIKLDNDNKLIATVKTYTNWNVEMYKNSLLYRFLFYLLVTIIIDYFLISENIMTVEAAMTATVAIPILAPNYLAPKK